MKTIIIATATVVVIIAIAVSSMLYQDIYNKECILGNGKITGFLKCTGIDVDYPEGTPQKDHNDQKVSTGGNANKVESSRHCYLAPEPGMCKASIEKFYFDWESSSCKPFTWGGCGGVVPFDTLESCQVFCN